MIQISNLKYIYFLQQPFNNTKKNYYYQNKENNERNYQGSSQGNQENNQYYNMKGQKSFNKQPYDKNQETKVNSNINSKYYLKSLVHS